MKELTILERLMLIEILPKQGSYVAQKVNQGIIRAVSVTEQEAKKISFTLVDGKAFWDPDKAVSVTFDFTEAEEATIKQALKEKDARCEITPQIVSLYEKFMI